MVLEVRDEARLQCVARHRSAPSAPVKTLAELRAFNTAHASRDAIKYGQANLDVSDEMDLEKDRAQVGGRPRRRTSISAATHGIDEVMKAQKLDALLFPGASGAGIAAKPGYPTVIVPFGVVCRQRCRPRRAVPGGIRRQACPYGVSFTGWRAASHA